MKSGEAVVIVLLRIMMSLTNGGFRQIRENVVAIGDYILS